jgi:hypothetical protein
MYRIRVFGTSRPFARNHVFTGIAGVRARNKSRTLHNNREECGNRRPSCLLLDGSRGKQFLQLRAAEAPGGYALSPYLTFHDISS